MTEQQIEQLFELNNTLVDCVYNLISANRDMFQMLCVATGLHNGLQDPPDEVGGIPKQDMTGKPIRFE